MSESRSLSERPVYLISDLHLEADRPETITLFLDFLRGPARRARALFILGDLFEAWIGDDAPGRVGHQVAAGLTTLAADGIEVFFIAGNRDFLLGERYCRQAGMTLLQEPFLLRDPGPPLVLMHGDTLCTDDVAYQRFRRKVRQPSWQNRVLARPVWWRRNLARMARLISRLSNRSKPSTIMDVSPKAVTDCFRAHQVRLLIHGHTHRPAIHRIDLDGQPCVRIVLGDWHGEHGSVLALDSARTELMVLTRNPGGDPQLVVQDAVEFDSR